MKLNPLIIIPVFFFVSMIISTPLCAQENELEYKNELYFKGEMVYTGTYTDYYDTGNPKIVKNILRNAQVYFYPVTIY